MGATLAAGSAVVFFVLALVAITLTGFDRAAAGAVVLGLVFLALAIAGIAAGRRSP